MKNKDENKSKISPSQCNTDAIEALFKELTDYVEAGINAEYSTDHPVHIRKRQQEHSWLNGVKREIEKALRDTEQEQNTNTTLDNSEMIPSGNTDAIEALQCIRGLIYRDAIKYSHDCPVEEATAEIVAYRKLESIISEALRGKPSVDVEALKKKNVSSFDDRGWNACIEHLHEQGLIGVPEGYALVPVEPTEGMYLACVPVGRTINSAQGRVFKDMYKAMIKAAQEG